MNHMSTTVRNEQGKKANSEPGESGASDCLSLEDAVKPDDCLDPVKRLNWSFPRNRQAREALRPVMWTVAAHLLAEGLPIPSTNEEMEALTRRWIELHIIVAGNPRTRPPADRLQAFMREFLRLACPPAPPEAEAM
jgi:hypothetical protein